MDILTYLPDLTWGNLRFALSAMFVFTAVVFFHELGHYCVGRLCNVGVDAFSIGFGRELLGFTDRHGTRWKLCWIPLGGYVKFHGDLNAASVPDQEALAELAGIDKERTLAAKPVGQRAAVVAAGPIASFLLAIFIFAGLFAGFGKPLLPPVVGEVTPGSAAEEAAFQAGDLILEVNGQKIISFRELQRITSVSTGQRLAFSVERGGELITLEATPRRQEITDRFGQTQRVGILGISPDAASDSVIIERFNIFTGLVEAVKETAFIVTRTLSYLWNIVTGHESAEQIGGPIRIVYLSGQVASVGFLSLLNLTAVLSASIGLINLFPIPLLDGGHLSFYLIEAIRGRPLGERAQEIGFFAGLGIILFIFLFASWNDIQFLLGS